MFTLHTVIKARHTITFTYDNGLWRMLGHWYYPTVTLVLSLSHVSAEFWWIICSLGIDTWLPSLSPGWSRLRCMCQWQAPREPAIPLLYCELLWRMWDQGLILQSTWMCFLIQDPRAVTQARIKTKKLHSFQITGHDYLMEWHANSAAHGLQYPLLRILLKYVFS